MSSTFIGLTALNPFLGTPLYVNPTDFISSVSFKMFFSHGTFLPQAKFNPTFGPPFCSWSFSSSSLSKFYLGYVDFFFMKNLSLQVLYLSFFLFHKSAICCFFLGSLPLFQPEWKEEFTKPFFPRQAIDGVFEHLRPSRSKLSQKFI